MAYEIAPLELTAGEMAAAMEGALVSGDPDRRVDGFSIDTRTLTPGDLFFAIRGARFDGHQFVATALAHGACGAVVSETSAVPRAGAERPTFLIAVADTTRALQALARHVRRRSGARVVAITGSAGKTTTKEITAALVAGRYRVFRNKGNLNNHIGLPLSLLELRSVPEIAVVELGMSAPGEIRTLVGIAEPDIRVWTNVGEAHLAFFPSVDAIADAKAEILERAGPETVLVANADDTRVMAHARRFAGRVVTFGIDHAADIRATAVEDLGLDGTRVQVDTPEGAATLRSPLIGRGNLANLLAATAVALQFAVPLADIVGRASRLQPAAHRGEVLRLPGGVTVVDDSYNSSPPALARALEVVRRASGVARRVAVLGEMLELGETSPALHAACGRLAAAAGLSRLVTVGGEPARALAAAAVETGMPAAAVAHVATSEQAAELAATMVRPGDLVLVKGSRGVGTDRVVERLKAEFA